MAKKKSRSVNVARKREKRNRNRKSKSKQIAAEKHNRVSLERMDEQRLHSYLLKSYDLLDEPEIQELHFDLDMVENELLDLIREPEHQGSNVEENPALEYKTFEEHEADLLSRLITTQFRKELLRSLNACADRLKKLGRHERADVAYVARSIFEIVPADVMVGHPIIQCIGQQSIHLLFEERFNSEDFSALNDFFAKVQENDYDEFQQNETFSRLFSKAISKRSNDIEENQQELIVNIPSLAQEQESELYPETLPAKALYKNFDGLKIRDSLINWKGQSLKKETETQLDFINRENELYITVTENRLQLHAENEEKLNTAMTNLEIHCQSAVMYLAKTFDEGGETDAT